MTTSSTATATRTPALVSSDQIRRDPYFSFRADGLNAAHKADLGCTLKNAGGPFDPLLLWQPDDDGKLILLDGLHRLAAYRAAKWDGEIPVIILRGVDRRGALGEALKANAKQALSLTSAERLDAAWRLVREPVEPRFKVREIVRLIGVSGRTVDNMRKRLRDMEQAEEPITGRWARDRRSLPDGDEEMERMTDDQREAEIRKLAGEYRDLTDRRKHPERAILRDTDAIFDAMLQAFGERKMKDMLEYLLGDDAREWLKMAASASGVESVGEDEEPEPPF